jgi:hydrogenase maturation factor
MRRPINHRAKSPVKIIPVPIPDPDPIIEKLIAVEDAILEEDNQLIDEENKILDPNVVLEQEEVMSFVLTHEDEIINYIKDKATKETLKSLAPLLEKLEEAVKQQQAYQQPVLTSNNSPTPMNYDEQLKKLQETSKNRIKEKELKITERMNKLQARFANIRK